MSSFSHAFAAELLNARTRKGYTQEQISYMLGISTRWYQKLEKGESEPNLLTAICLIDCLEIDTRVFHKEVEKMVHFPAHAD